MKFSFADVVRAPKLGFSAKKIWVGFLGLLFGTIVYSVLAYVAFVITPGWTWQSVWREYRYIPYLVIPFRGVGDHMPWYSWTIWAIGIILFVFIVLTALCAIGKLTFEQLKGNEFYEIMESVKFAVKQWKGTLLSPVVLAIFIASLLLIGFIWGLVGRIPYAGQILTGLFFIPIAFGALFVVYLAIVFVLSLIISPAVTATTESDTFDTLFEVFSCLNDQTWRVVLWEIYVGFAGLAGIYILGWLMKKALLLMQWALALWQGPRHWWDIIWNNALWYLPKCPPVRWVEWFVVKYLHLPVLLKIGVNWMQTNWADWIGSFLGGLSLYMLGFFVLAYGLATWGAGQTLIYTVLVKIKDEKDLIEEAKEKEEEELEVEEEKEEEKKEETKEEEKKE